MPRDNKSSKLSKESVKKSKKSDELARRKKTILSSDSDDNASSDSENENENENEMDVHEYRKFLSKIFPSKNLDKKIKAGEKLKEIIESEEEEWEECDESEEDTTTNKKTKKDKNVKRSKKQKVVKKPKKQKVETESEESLGSQDSDSESESESEDDEIGRKKSSKFNIIFTIGGANDRNEDEYEDEDEDDSEWLDEDDSEWEESSDEETENEDDSICSDSESASEKGKSKILTRNQKKELKIKQEKQDKKQDKKQNKKTCKKSIIEKNEDSEKNSENEKEKETEQSTELLQSEDETLKELQLLLEKNKNNKTIQKCLGLYEEEVKNKKEKDDKKKKKQKDKNSRIFKKILKDKNTMNDFKFFQKLETTEQKTIIKELREINKITRIEKPYRITLLESTIPTLFKSAAMKKINSLRYMEPGSGEFYKIKNWVDTFMRIPFGENKTLPITITDGVDKCHEFMENAQKCLNDAVYGLNDAKMQIMQMLGQLVTNPKAIGSAIAIHGPPGTGKTSLVKEGISKILNRPFAFIALGGATDSSFLEGHSYTYEGSTWGKIVQILIDSKCMNPVIYFDELDKISDTPKGEEIAGILTHLTDTSQNSQYHDKYFAEIDFDLSKCLFIFSYNDETKVNPILRDRMYRIQTKGYNQKQKTVISTNYLLPKIREQVKFEECEILIPNETIHYIIYHLCNKEDGVRNLKRCLEIIYTKLNLYRLMKPNSNLFEEDMSLKVEFPYTVTKDVVDKLIKNEKDKFSSALYSMYI